MSKIDEWIKENSAKHGKFDVVPVCGIPELIQIVRDECQPKWISVDGYKEVPLGNWLVKMDKDLCGSHVHAMKSFENISVIGSVFAFDAPKVIAYMDMPK